MRLLNDFDFYVKIGIVKKQLPDRLRAASLINETNDSYLSLIDFFKKIGVTDRNANHFVKNAYDVIMGLIRAKMILEGYNSSGKGAHEAEVAYFKKLGFNDNEVEFINQLRYFRNGIMYYGKRFDEDYVKKVLNFLEKVVPKLKRLIII
ncbi:MAG: hypothetical protein KKG60_03905 [Nanoarchaeota archaeon]|nr:hypothetical protein [Nanoarchaeota archaeon]